MSDYNDSIDGYLALNSDPTVWLALTLRLDGSKSLAWLERGKIPDKIRDITLDSIVDLTDIDFRTVMRTFLPPGTGVTKGEAWIAPAMLPRYQDRQRRGRGTEYERRYLASFRGDQSAAPTPDLTWVLDLTAHDPSVALQIVRGYLLAHSQFLHDVTIDGLDDFMTALRMRAVRGVDGDEPLVILKSLSPQDLEAFTASLWRKLGYVVERTRATRDGGYDVRASQTEFGTNHTILIECKQWSAPVDVSTVRALLGVLVSEDAEKAVLVAPGGFSLGSGASESFATDNRRIELLDGPSIVALANSYLGVGWHRRVDVYLRD